MTRKSFFYFGSWRVVYCVLKITQKVSSFDNNLHFGWRENSNKTFVVSPMRLFYGIFKHCDEESFVSLSHYSEN